VETVVPATDAAEILNQISLGLLDGAMIIKNADRQYMFHPGQVVEMEIKVEEDGTKGKMRLELAWRVPLNITTE
jgi:amphi-Trp domain-containing protein